MYLERETQEEAASRSGEHLPLRAPPPARWPLHSLGAPESFLQAAPLRSVFISQQGCVSQVAANRNKTVGVEMALDLQKKATP